MSHCERETEFLSQMLVSGENAEYRELQAQLIQTQKALGCIRRATRRVILLMMLCLAGVGYSTVFLPEFLQGRPHYLVNLFTTVILACLICLTAYCGIWLWQSHTAAKIHIRCRRALLGREQTRTNVDAVTRIRHLRQLEEPASLRFDRAPRGFRVDTPDTESPLKAP